MKILAIAQARINSTRLPGKVLADIAGKPMFQHVLDRALKIPDVAGVVLTVPEREDAQWFKLLPKGGPYGVCFGPHPDVLTSFVRAVAWCRADAVMRLTCDNPLLAPELCWDVLKAFVDSGADYAENLDPIGCGFDTEVFTLDALLDAHRRAESVYDREHVTAFIQRNEDLLKLHVPLPERIRTVTLSVDTQADLTRVRLVFDHLADGEASWASTVRAMKAAGIH